MSVRESFVARRRNSVQSRPALNVEEEEGEEEAEGAGNKQGSKSSLPCDTPEVLPTIAFSKEELELNAANKIKRAYKYFVVRASFFRILRLHFIKIYSSTESRYVYKNRVNGKYRITKPMYIGEEDLPVHEVYEAPADYFPSSRKDGPGFALLITVTTFDHPRIPSLSEHCRADHEDIYKALKHEYRARFNPENIISLLDPTLQEVLKAFETLRKWMRRKKQSFLVVYICTHVITAYKGEVKKPLSEQEQDCYFLLKESVWRTPETIATSSLSLRKLCILLNDLPHLSKTVILHYAHLAMPKKSVFGITKLLYPPPGFLARLSRESNAAVIGSCMIGMSLSETVLQSSTSIIKPLLSLSPNAEAQPDSELSLTNADLEKLTDYYRREWRVPEDPAQALVSCDTHKSPTYSFTRDSKTGAVAVTLPRDEEMRSFYLHYVSDEAKKVFQLPVNAAQSALAAQSRKAIKAPIQLTLSSSHCR